MKKIFKFIRFTLIGSIWSYCFFFITNFAFYNIWNFNFMSSKSWKTVSAFWNRGGIIKSSSDYIFFFVMISLPLIWILCWKKLLKVNYTDLLLYPIKAYNRRIIQKYGTDSPRIVLKNMKSNQKIIDEIKEQIASIKPEKNKESGNIRSEINKKLNQLNK